MSSLPLPLPTISALRDTTDLPTTVYPYLHQLSTSHLASLFSGPVSPRDWYLTTNPLITAIFIALSVSILVFLSAELNRNVSQVDRIWSFLPTAYIAHFTLFAHLHGLDTTRLDTLLMATGLWSARLTFNYWRRGGYQWGSEDYRWEVVRSRIGAAGMFVLDLTFISFIQNFLLLAIATPAYLLLLLARNPLAPAWTTPDLIFSRAIIVLILLETLADQQQWTYHLAKSHFKTHNAPPKDSAFTAEDLTRGFNVAGLWSYSRHPNFLCEQLIWLTVYQWACYITEGVWNWTAIGAGGLCLLFQGSTVLTEEITAGKYKEYAEYQRLVGRFLPGFGRYGRTEEERKRQ